MGQTIADKILTAVLASQAIAAVPMPAPWVTSGVDILSIDLWSASAFTIKGATGQTEISVAANQVITLAIRINVVKGTATLPFFIANAANVNMLAHAIDHAYADQG
jgi:hypothetical protein